MAAKYRQLADQLKKQILESPLSGYKLPTEAALCRKYEVSRQTVRAALALLEEDGLISRRQGSGSFARAQETLVSLRRVALVLSSDNDYLYPVLISDIRKPLQEAGYHCDVHVNFNQIRTERRILQSLLEDPPQGLIIEGSRTSLPTPNADLLDKLRRAGTAILFIRNAYSNTPQYPVLLSDNAAGGTFLARFLLSRGHRRIFGIFPSDAMDGLERYQGMASVLYQETDSFSDENICWFTYADYRGLELEDNTVFLSSYIKTHLHKGDSVICHNDEIAYWLSRELEKEGYVIPADISIVSFDNSYLSNLAKKKITSLSHKPHEMGQSAASMIMKLMDGRAVPHTRIGWHLAEKESHR